MKITAWNVLNFAINALEKINVKFVRMALIGMRLRINAFHRNVLLDSILIHQPRNVGRVRRDAIIANR